MSNNKVFSSNKKFIFIFLKILVEKIINNKYLNFVQKEDIDAIIKYIDLYDINLNRTGIKQIYKNFDNEEW